MLFFLNGREHSPEVLYPVFLDYSSCEVNQDMRTLQRSDEALWPFCFDLPLCLDTLRLRCHQTLDSNPKPVTRTKVIPENRNK